MNTAYIAISYICNQKCSFCPCTKEEKKYSEPSLENLIKNVNKILENPEIDSIVVSGGEPTLYSRFIEFLQFLCKKPLKSITVLSTSERFSNSGFIQEFSEHVDLTRLSVVSTLHSHLAEEHEHINLTPHSFERTIQGLKNLHRIGVKTTVKHCITKDNYKDLKTFFEFVNNCFDEETDIQLCSIDYCGIPEEEYEEQMLPFPSIAPFLEEMLDAYIERTTVGSKRMVYCIYMPLCTADPYYWDYFMKNPGGYSAFASSADKGEVYLSSQENNDVGTYSESCKVCVARSICSGTYRSAFINFGDRIVEPYIDEEAGK